MAVGACFACAAELHGALDTSRSPASALVVVAWRDALEHLATFERSQVLHLAHPVQVCGSWRVDSGAGGQGRAGHQRATARQHLASQSACFCDMVLWFSWRCGCAQVAGIPPPSTPTRLFGCLRPDVLGSIRVAAGPHWSDGGDAPQRRPLRGRLAGGRVSVDAGQPGADRPSPPPLPHGGVSGPSHPVGGGVGQPFAFGVFRAATASTWVGREAPTSAGGQHDPGDSDAAGVDGADHVGGAAETVGMLREPQPPLAPGVQVVASSSVIGAVRRWAPQQDGVPRHD